MSTTTRLTARRTTRFNSRLALPLALAVTLGSAAGCDDNVVMVSPDDLAVADQHVTVPDDLSTIPDMAKPIDIAAPTDGPPPDLTVIHDLVIPPDLIPPGPAPTIVLHQDFVNFCVAFTACGLTTPDVTLSICTTLAPQPGQLSFASPATLTCLMNAGADCAKIKTCLNNGDPNTTCNNDAGAQPACTNGVYSECEQGNFKFATDCTKQGFVCLVAPGPPKAPDSTQSGCAFGSCNTDAGVGTNYCASGFASACNGGGRLYASEDCRVFGNEVCNINDAGSASCVGTGNACTTGKCQNTTLIACKGGHEASFDCAKAGLTCVDQGGGKVSCGLGKTCDPNTFIETCVGPILTYCDAGKITMLDCMKAGWKRCVPQVNGNGGYCFAM